jgi:RNA recognition motif-containing protein
MNIYVGNLAYGVTDEDLQEAFGEHGAVASANIIKDRETGKSKGFGFVEMENQAGAEKAITNLDGKPLKGRNIKVNQARPKNEKPRSKPKRW